MFVSFRLWGFSAIISKLTLEPHRMMGPLIEGSEGMRKHPQAFNEPVQSEKRPKALKRNRGCRFRRSASERQSIRDTRQLPNQAP